MNYQKIFLSIALIFLFSYNIFAQSAEEAISPDGFSSQLMEELITQKLNQYRAKNNLDTFLSNEILYNAAKDQADYMNKEQKLEVEQGTSSKKTTEKRITYFGGSGTADEIILNITAGKGKNWSTYDAVAQDVVNKISTSKKLVLFLNSASYFYASAAVSFDAPKKKIWLSVVLAKAGSMSSKKATGKKALPVKYTKKNYGVQKTDIKDCKACDKFDDIQALQRGLWIEKGKVYLEYLNLKKLQKLLRGDQDGLSVDIVQRAQYPCGTENIYDNNLFSRGIFLKPKYSKKLFAANTYKDPKENKFAGPIGKIKKKYLKKLGDNYELNAVVIINKKFCKNITRSYLEDGGLASLNPLNMYPDTIQENDSKRYKLTNEQNILTFNIPFEQNKFTYDPKDIQPFIDSVEGAKFVIDSITITANSSMEGDSNLNAGLQKKRAESILDALEKTQIKKFVRSVQTSDSWEMFKEQIKGTEWNDMANTTKAEVKKNLQDDATRNKMEPILAKERFAGINMKVTYDITGANEQSYVLSSLKRAVDKKDAAQTLRIQRYAISQVVAGKYDYNNLLAIQYPKEAAYASLHVNQIWLGHHYLNMDTFAMDEFNRLEDLFKLTTANEFVTFNKFIKTVKYDEVSLVTLNDIQNKINALYNGKIPQRIVDAMNLEYQFKIIEMMDTSAFDSESTETTQTNPIVAQCMERIKKIFNIENTTTWQNSLKLAYIFIKHNDKEFAMKTLQPFIKEGEDIDENVAFTFISIASHYADKIYDKTFRIALTAAKKKNEQRYCELFGAPKLSFQLLEHPIIKEDYCRTCEGVESEEKESK